MQVRLNYREPRITEPEPDGPDNLTEREPKSPMIASPAADDCKPLQLEIELARETETAPEDAAPSMESRISLRAFATAANQAEPDQGRT